MSGRTPDEGRYSKVSRRMWDDEGFRKLSAPKPNARTLWKRLLTGPELGCVPGLFAAREGGLADALEWPVAALHRCWLEIERQGMARADWRAGLVWVPNAIVHNAPQSVNAILGWRLALRELPECDLKRAALIELGEYISGMGESWSKAFGMATGKPSAMASPKPNNKPSGMGSRIQEQDSGARARSPAATGSQDLTDLTREKPPTNPETAATAVQARGLMADPHSLADALQMPLKPRCEVLARNPAHFGMWLEPEKWPEVVAIAQALAQATGKPGYERLSVYTRDAGVQAVVALYAAGYTQADVEHVVRNVTQSTWWRRDDKSRGLSSLTPEVVRRTLAEDPRRDELDPRVAKILADRDARKAEGNPAA